MGRRPKWGRSIDGVIVLNKDSGMTSNAALQQAKRLFFAKRAGHTGSLDPLATGVLPLCFGESTKFSQYLLDADKCYESTFRLGVRTQTSDCDGDIVETVSAGHITRDSIECLLPGFRGQIQQTPSIYSALKFQGKPLYQWAREGLELPADAIKTRQVTIYRYDIVGYRGTDICGDKPEVDVIVSCSKGTYIRSLAEDLGQRLGVGAHVIRLHRKSAGPFHDEQALSLSELDALKGDHDPEYLDRHLLPIDSPVDALPKVEISADMATYFLQGQAVMSTEAYRYGAEGDMVRVYSDRGLFLGLAELCESNLAPKRIVNRL